MVVAVDKFTAVKMYDKVQAHWKEEIKRLVGQIGKTKDDAAKERLRKAGRVHASRGNGRGGQRRSGRRGEVRRPGIWISGPTASG